MSDVTQDPGPQPGDIYESYSGGFYEVLERSVRGDRQEIVAYRLAEPEYPAGQIFEMTVAEFMGTVQLSLCVPTPRFRFAYSRPCTGRGSKAPTITIDAAEAKALMDNAKRIMAHHGRMAAALNRIQGLAATAMRRAESGESAGLKSTLKQIATLAGARDVAS